MLASPPPGVSSLRRHTNIPVLSAPSFSHQQAGLSAPIRVRSQHAGLNTPVHTVWRWSSGAVARSSRRHPHPHPLHPQHHLPSSSLFWSPSPSPSASVPRLMTTPSSSSLRTSAVAGTQEGITQEGSAAPLFRFGLISDTQYVNDEDGTNFTGSKIRRYRHSLEVLKRAVRSWNHLEEREDKPLAFIVQLGDAIDGKCAALNQSKQATQDIKDCVNESVCNSWHFCIGNHEMYNFSVEEWVKEMYPEDQSCSYYDFVPYEGWRVVVLNSYEISIMAPEGSGEYDQAFGILSENNPNVLNGGNWFENVKGEERRFLPYNGQFSDHQLTWFQGVVDDAALKGERVLVCCHQPCYAPATNTLNLPYNFQQALQVIHSRPGTVVAWMAGHDHDGGYAVDDMGIHHIVPAAPLECQVGEDAYGVVEVLPESQGVRINWAGKMPVKGQWSDLLRLPARGAEQTASVSKL